MTARDKEYQALLDVVIALALRVAVIEELLKNPIRRKRLTDATLDQPVRELGSRTKPRDD